MQFKFKIKHTNHKIPINPQIYLTYEVRTIQYKIGIFLFSSLTPPRELIILDDVLDTQFYT